MTASLACRYLESLWPAPAAFAALSADGSRRAGDPVLAARAAELLGRDAHGSELIRDGGLVIVRRADGGALAAEAPRAALPGLLEQDLRRAAA